MKKLSLLLLLFIAATINAQDILKTELFDVDVVMKYQSQIELTANQRENIKKVHNTHISDFNNTKWDLDAEMETLNGLLEKPNINEKEALQQMKVVTDMENRLKMRRLEMLIQVKNELTEAQQKKLKTLRTDSDLKPTSLITTINDGQKIKFQVGKSKDPSKEPLFVILDKNGEKIVNKLFMSSLDSDNIESVNVLKGRSAKTTYGKKGENGVILIKLKDNK